MQLQSTLQDREDSLANAQASITLLEADKAALIAETQRLKGTVYSDNMRRARLIYELRALKDLSQCVRTDGYRPSA